MCKPRCKLDADSATQILPLVPKSLTVWFTFQMTHSTESQTYWIKTQNKTLVSLHNSIGDPTEWPGSIQANSFSRIIHNGQLNILLNCKSVCQQSPQRPLQPSNSILPFNRQIGFSLTPGKKRIDQTKSFSKTGPFSFGLSVQGILDSHASSISSSGGDMNDVRQSAYTNHWSFSYFREFTTRYFGHLPGIDLRKKLHILVLLKINFIIMNNKTQ